MVTKYPKGSDDGRLSDGRCSGGGYHSRRLPQPAATSANTMKPKRSTKKDCSSGGAGGIGEGWEIRWWVSLDGPLWAACGLLGIWRERGLPPERLCPQGRASVSGPLRRVAAERPGYCGARVSR